MKITNKQKKDLETILYFAPKELVEKYPITNKDIEDFFNYSDRGIAPADHSCGTGLGRDRGKPRGYHSLLEGKRWRGIHVHELYEPGVRNLTVPYFILLGGIDKEKMPRSVVDFLKREMFKGQDADIIEKCYQSILHA